MNDSGSSDAVAAGIGIVVILGLLVFSLAFYLFVCYCYKRICEKCGETPGILIWIPIAHWIPLLRVAKMELWMIILLLIPIVNIVIFAMMFAKICTARGKSPWLVVMLFIPFVNLAFIPYLAFSE